MTPKRQTVLGVMACIALLLAVAGCTSVPMVQRDATLALIQRKDFDAAAKAAPDWVGAALQQITMYEAELARTQPPTTK